MNHSYTTPYDLDIQAVKYHLEKYQFSYAGPPFQIVPERHTPLRPFEDKQPLIDGMFREYGDRQSALDPLNFPGERATIQDRQIRFLLDHLAARHAISNEILQNIAYQEATANSRLEDVRSWPFPTGIASKRASELEKQLSELGKERWEEEVACWKDTSRVLSDLFEHWTDYSDQSRRARLMDFGL